MIFPSRWLALALAVASCHATALAAVPVISTSDWPTSARPGGGPFAYQIRASDSPTSYDATGLPVGLAIDRATGQISSTLPTPATTTFTDITLQATNASGTGTARVTLFIQIPPRLVPPPDGWSQTAMVNTDYSFRPQWAGGSPLWPGFRASGVPAGLSFEPATGVLSGKPTTPGTYPVTLTVTNEAGSDTATLTLQVVNDPPGPPEVRNVDLAADHYISDRGRETTSYYKRIRITATNFPTSFAYTSGLRATSFDPATGTLDFNINDMPPGLHAITLSATNGKGTGSKTIRWAIHPRVADMSFVGNAPYYVGDTITIHAKFNSPVVVTGKPTIGVSPRHRVAYVSGSGTDTLTFTRRTSAEDYFPGRLEIPNQIDLDDGTIAHASGPAAILTADVPRLETWYRPHDGVYLMPTGTTGAPASSASASRLANLSARLHVSDDDPRRSFITGFVIAGTQAQRILVRASGPALTAFGVQGALPNPRVQIFDTSGRIVAENDDWSGADTRAAAEQLGAFALRDGSADAVVLVTLPPGPYTARVLANGSSGVALTEIYDAATEATVPARPPLVNLSTRGFVGTGENALAVGFVIAGSTPKSVLIRGLGPALSAFGLTGLADPLVTLQQGNTTLAANDDWHVPASPTSPTAAEISSAAAAAGAFPLAAGKDAALLLTLPPGAYTALVRGAADTTGLALVEVYELSASAP